MKAIGERRAPRHTVSVLAMLGLVAGTIAVVLAASPAVAMTVQDQYFTAPTNLYASINDACKYVAQTFTAGVTGTLTGVNIDVVSEPGAPPLRVVIRNARNDRALGDPLGTRTLADPQAPLSRLIVFTEGIPVVAGEHYAIQVNYQRGGTQSDLGTWVGGTGNHYPGGRYINGACVGVPQFWFMVHGWSGYDLHFRTYVEPAP